MTEPDVGAVGRVERALDRLRRLLQHQVSVGALIELSVWLALPYLVIGVVWAVVHPEQTQRIQARVEMVMPVGADVAAFGLAMALWPVSLQIADACPAK